MSHTSEVVEYKLVLESSTEINNCFFCNLDNGAVFAEAYIDVFIDSCFFEEDTNWENGGALHVRFAKSIALSKIYAKACCTKSNTGSFAAGQFAYLYQKLNESQNFLIESSVSSCAPFLENVDKRSVIEFAQGIIQVNNANFSNNMANTQIIFTSALNSKLKYITLYRNVLYSNILFMNYWGDPFYESCQVVMNTMNNDKKILAFFRLSNAKFLNCCFKDCSDYSFTIELNCQITIESCYLESNFEHDDRIQYRNIE